MLTFSDDIDGYRCLIIDVQSGIIRVHRSFRPHPSLRRLLHSGAVAAFGR